MSKSTTGRQMLEVLEKRVAKLERDLSDKDSRLAKLEAALPETVKIIEALDA